jgi:2-oxoglutarate ferredoxin oxidoreductase subunit alpha
MTKNEINWMIGGPQGSGVDSAANIFGRACGYGGLYVYGKREYHSNIKGLHSYFHVRVSEQEILSNVDAVDLLVAFDAETIVRHVREVVPEGGIICDQATLSTKIMDIPTLTHEFKAEFGEYLKAKRIGDTLGNLIGAVEKENIRVYPIPYLDLLKEVAVKIGEEKLSRVTRMINVLALGISFSFLNYDKELVRKSIRAIFSEKPRIAQINVIAFDKAYDYAKERFGDTLNHRLEKLRVFKERIFMQGNLAVALGKILGGCRMQTYYPITPAADESEYLEAHEILETKQQEEEAIIVIQTEDEIAAVNMASGAALAGTRAATSTSGPGFSLMVEGLGWAGNNEAPLVITYYQRGAPSTGLPTRHGQDDLRFAIHASHGEFPRIVLASGDMKECFYDAVRVFNYAERYQMPVIHLVDKALANSTQTYEIFDLRKVRIERGAILAEKDIKSDYKRFRFAESGVSPRVLLGTPGGVHWYTGDEHNEFGHISEEPFNRTSMMDKRMRKLELVDKEVPIQERVNFFGKAGSETIVVSWGSPKGAILDAIKMLEKEGFELSFLQVRMVHPFPKEYVASILNEAQTKIDVEMNYSGQLAGIIREKTGIVIDNYILKYNGRPMSSTEVYESIKKILLKKAPKRQVLTHGA